MVPLHALKGAGRLPESKSTLQLLRQPTETRRIVRRNVRWLGDLQERVASIRTIAGVGVRHWTPSRFGNARGVCRRAGTDLEGRFGSWTSSRLRNTSSFLERRRLHCVLRTMPTHVRTVPTSVQEDACLASHLSCTSVSRKRTGTARIPSHPRSQLLLRRETIRSSTDRETPIEIPTRRSHPPWIPR